MGVPPCACRRRAYPTPPPGATPAAVDGPGRAPYRACNRPRGRGDSPRKGAAVGDGWELLQRIGDLLYALVDVLWSFGVLLYALLPVGLWCVWWLCAVDWKRLWPVLARGAWAPVVLLMVAAALAW